MQTQIATAGALKHEGALALETAATFFNLRVLAWQGSVLYASRRYTLFRSDLRATTTSRIRWEEVARFRPPWWRKLTASSRLTLRLCRDGFHSLAVLPSGNLVAAVPGAIVTLEAGGTEFSLSHRITRGTRPLHFASTPDGRIFFGEYFDNRQREPVHIYGSRDQGRSWQIAYTFGRGEIRHVHNIVYDPWDPCFWILTGDYGAECRILRASLDFKQVDPVISGNQQARAVALVPTREAIYFSSDTPLEKNYVNRLDRAGQLSAVADLPTSSIYGCRAGDKVFFSTMIEPSEFNVERDVHVYGGGESYAWTSLCSWKKDFLPMRFFQYGNVIMPDGENTSGLLALTTVAVQNGDFQTTILRIGSTKSADV